MRMTVNTAAWLEPGFEWPHYAGVQCQQFQSDMARYRELIEELKPPFVIEIGRAFGGTALMLADAMESHRGYVISIDVDPAIVDHPWLICIEGSSTDPFTLQRIAGLVGTQRGLVLIDGDHDHLHVYHELDAYHQWADYLVVEDTIMGDLPGMENNGPHMALERWRPKHRAFYPDADPMPTQHPGGWLRRIEEVQLCA